MANFAEQLRAYEEWKEFQEKTPEAFEEHQALLLTDKRVRYIFEWVQDLPEHFNAEEIYDILKGGSDDIVNGHFATTKGIEE